MPIFTRRRSRTPLDDVLLTWPTGDEFTVADLLRSIEVKGITGSGKSSGSLAFLLEQIVKHPRSTLLILAQKPEERDEIAALFEKYGKPLRIIEPTSDWLCNLIQDDLDAGADDRALTELFVNQGEALQEGMGNTGDNAKYFRMLEDRILQMTFGALRMAGETVTPGNVRDFIATAAYKHETLADPEWKKSYHFTVLDKASKASKNLIDANDFQSIKSFFSNEFVHLDEKPRSGAISGIMNTAFVFSTGQAWRTCATQTTCSPSVIEEGVSVLVNYPTSKYGPTGKFIANGFKFKWEKYILARKWNPNGYFCVIACDEFQEAVTEADSRFISQCRSHGGCLLTATQTVHSEYSRMGGGHASHHKVEALTSNYGLHIFHLSDPQTAETAAKLLGQRLEIIVDGSPDDERTLWDEITGKSRMRHSYKQQYTYVLQPRVFLTGLRTGGSKHGNIVDGIVIRVGEPFRNGENYQYVAFNQPKR